MPETKDHLIHHSDGHLQADGINDLDVDIDIQGTKSTERSTSNIVVAGGNLIDHDEENRVLPEMHNNEIEPHGKYRF